MADQKPRLWSDDTRSNEELFAATLVGDYQDEEAWDAVSVLRTRGTQEIFDLAKHNLASTVTRKRSRALDVLGQLGSGLADSERPYLRDCVSLAIEHLDDSEPEVVSSAAWALAHLEDSRSDEKLLRLKSHPDSNVRQAVAYGVSRINSLPEAIHVLIELMEDEDDEVRNWATFALGNGYSLPDSPEIRAALKRRLEDSFIDVRHEAVWGLARRKDSTGLTVLLDRLGAQSWVAGDEEAALEALDLSDKVPIDQLVSALHKLISEQSS